MEKLCSLHPSHITTSWEPLVPYRVITSGREDEQHQLFAATSFGWQVWRLAGACLHWRAAAAAAAAPHQFKGAAFVAWDLSRGFAGTCAAEMS